MRRRVDLGAEHKGFGLLGHRSAGKTTVAEMLLATTGALRAAGRVDDGTTLMDHDDEERRKRVGLWPSFAWMPWGDGVLDMVDTPGGAHIAHVRDLSMLAADLAVLVVSGAGGVEVGAERALDQARRDGTPMLAVVNKLDRPHLDLAGVHASLGKTCGRRAVSLTLPVFDGGCLAGVVDVLGNRVLRYDPSGSGALSVEPVPAPRAAEVAAAREVLVEAAAMADDALLERYLEYFDLPDDEVWSGLAAAVAGGTVLPVVHTSALRRVGAEPLLDALWRLSPKPSLPEHAQDEAFVAQWVGTRFDDDGKPVHLLKIRGGRLDHRSVLRNGRTQESVRVQKYYAVRGPRRSVCKDPVAGAVVATWETLPGLPGDTFSAGGEIALPSPAARPKMAWLHVAARAPRDDGRLLEALATMQRVDPSLAWSDEADGEGMRLAGTSHGQLGLILGWVRTRMGIAFDQAAPTVPYLERPTGSVRDVHGLHVRMHNGEVAEFGECWLDLKPMPGADTLRFRGDVDEEILPARFVPPIGEGARRALEHGPTAGFPVRGVEVRCTRGEYDALESSPEHFEVAGERAMMAALEAAGTELLEPWSEVLLVAPSDQVGPILADLQAHRGRVMGLEVEDEETSVQVQCPEREVQTLSARLESLTRGRAWFVCKRSHWDKVPGDLVAEIVAHSPRQALAAQRRAG